MKTALRASLALLLLPSLAEASPWTLQQGQGVLNAGFDFQLATSEFINEGGERDFPLSGRFTGATLNLGGRLGLTDEFEVEIGLPIRVVAYTSDPAIIAVYEGNDPEAALAHYQANLLDFSQTGAGIGDLSIAGRYRLLLRPIAIATELRIRAPTGYEGPEGTFGREPDSIEAFNAAGAELVRPENIRDDVSLGDGVLDVSLQLLLGTAFSSGTFIRAGGGYNLRFGGAGDQVLAHLRLGQSLGRRVLIYAFGDLAYTVQEGRSVGVSITANDPNLGPQSFARGANTRPIVRRLERNALEVGGGIIFRVAGPVELNISYGRTIWGRFTAASHAASVGIGIRADVFGQSAVRAASK